MLFYQVEVIVKFITFSPLSLDTCRLSLTSHLFPRTILSTSAEACCGRKFGIMNTKEINQDKVCSDLWNKNTKKLTQNEWKIMFLQAKGQKTHSQTHSLIWKYFTSSIFRIQFLMLSKDFSLVMSYTNMMPWGVQSERCKKKQKKQSSQTTRESCFSDSPLRLQQTKCQMWFSSVHVNIC